MELNLLRLLAETTVGVALMTAFSYAVSLIVSECYKEPALLEILLRPNVENSERRPPVVGWVAHYFVGVGFALAYEAYWQYMRPEIDWINAAQLGLISGLIGILCWKIAYAVAKKKPRIDFKGFYLQLVLAHLLFAIGVAAVYTLWKS